MDKENSPGPRPRRSTHWRIADDIEILLDVGNKPMAEEELLKALATQRLVNVGKQTRSASPAPV